MGDQQNGQDAVFHITHWKAGSMWVHGVMKQLARDRLVQVSGDQPDEIKAALRPGGVYSPVYLGKTKFLQVVGDLPHKRVIVIRDLRDTLVSWYFSLRYSHPSNSFVADQRAQLEAKSVEDGLLFLIQERLEHMMWVQRSWIGDEGLLMRYEDMVADEYQAYKRIADYAGFAFPEDVLKRVVTFNSFEDRTGRKRGDEDRANHRRKGIAGDWKNHFTDRVTEMFREKFGQHLIDTEYEKSLDW